MFRIWDVFFVEGHDTLFRVALAILKLNEAEICLTESAGDLFVFVSGMTSRLWAADKLIAVSSRPLPSFVSPQARKWTRRVSDCASCNMAIRPL